MDTHELLAHTLELIAIRTAVLTSLRRSSEDAHIPAELLNDVTRMRLIMHGQKELDALATTEQRLREVEQLRQAQAQLASSAHLDEQQHAVDSKASTSAASSSASSASSASKRSKYSASTDGQDTSILSFLCALEAEHHDVLDALYHDTFTCLTIFRSLPALGKQYVMRLMTLGPLGVARELMASWVKPFEAAKQLHEEAIEELLELQVLQQVVPVATLSEVLTVAGKEAAQVVEAVEVVEDGDDEEGDEEMREAGREAPESKLERLDKAILEQLSFGDIHLSLTPSFRHSLQRALLGRSTAAELEGAEAARERIDEEQMNREMPPDKHAPTMEQLQQFALSQWEGILHFMAGCRASQGGVTMPDAGVQQLLVQTGLMQPMERGVPASSRNQSAREAAGLRITPAGFRFLFQSTHRQVWTFIIGYMSGLAERGMDRHQVLTFLFRLSFLQVGHDYPKTALTATQQALVADLCKLGLVYSRKASSRRFYPTPLASNLSSSSSGDSSGEGVSNASSAQQSGYIIVETTFRLLAYTRSEFQIALLSLFSRIEYHLPNMVVAKIDKRTVRRALQNNIAAKDIISFLREYAHPRLVRDQATNARDPSAANAVRHKVPPVVIDQIQLWEKERYRFKMNPGSLLTQFKSAESFDLACSFAKSRNTLKYSDPRNRRMVVDQAGVDELLRYIRGLVAARQRQQRSAAAAPSPPARTSLI